MGRLSHSRQLGLWMNGLRVGTWTQARNDQTLTYDTDWVQNPQGRPLSLSLPFTPGNLPARGARVQDWFDNLLPDTESIRRRLAQRYHAQSTSPFDLLSELGRDCVGALQLLPGDVAPTDLQQLVGDPLNEADIARLLRSTTRSAPPGRPDGEDDLRLSIAGAQEKTALLWHNNQWLLPQGSTPTTHIFKLPLGLVGDMNADMRTSVENEWLCAKLVAAFGLAVAPCEIGQFEDQKALIVTRFDRRLASDGRWIVRLPQEDFCQATGTSPLHKYQADGGPGIEAILQILRSSAQAIEDQRTFFKAILVFWLLAATDGHAKNFSIAQLAGGQYQLTPLYDILSAHPVIGTGRNRIAPQKVKMAMAVHSDHTQIYLMNRIQRKHWLALAKRSGLLDEATHLIDELIAQVDQVVSNVTAALPTGFPEDVAEAVFQGLRQQASRLAMT